MPQIQRIFKHTDIFKFIYESEPEKALALIEKKLKIEEDIEGKSWLFIYQAWIYYSLYQYYPLSHNAVNLVLKNREELSNCIIIEAYLIRALIHIKQNKIMYAYDSVETCLALDPNNSSANKLQELIILLLRK